MMKKIILTVLAALLLCFTASAQDFKKVNTYNEGIFKDVPSNAWYAKEVASAYELGFMNGKSYNEFVPLGNVTVAEGITMASRVHAIYSGNEIKEVSGGKWYDMYVNYAKEKGIISADEFDSYTRNITRAEMAYLFASALPQSNFNAVNNVSFIPDVNIASKYYEKILMLYKSGVVMGSDEYGTFNPESDIKRSESAAIINRVAIPENRVRGSLKEYNVRDAYKLAYSVGTYTNSISSRENTVRENMDAGWIVDNRGGAPITSIEQAITSLSDISTTEGASFIREFNKIEKDTILADYSLKAYGEGVYTEFSDENEKPVFHTKITDGKWQILTSDGKYTPLCDVSKEFESFRVILNLKNNSALVFINGKNCGTHALLSDNIMSFRFATDEKSTASFTPGKVSFNANYSVFEEFDLFGIESIYGWKTEGQAVVENGELVLKGKASVSKSFEALDTKYAAETYIYRSENEDMSLSLLSGNTVALRLEAKNGKLISGGKELYTLKGDMWYRVRMEANPSVGKAKIYLNGRVVGEVSLNSSSPVDSYVIASENGMTKYDYIEVFAVADHYDYVPEPEMKASFDDYAVFINVCSLWHSDGNHMGWSCITPYDDNKPLLGYYDEGVPELADWEINYMVNHGIDVQVFCWYNNKTKGALKDPSFADALHEGYMYSKYSDYMKYVILWETGGTTVNSEQFRKYVVPYWFENYFLDDRYLKIDNRIVLHSFGANRLADATYFGSPEKAKAELQYLNDVAKSYGFDGMLYTCADSGTAFSIGFEARGAYHWEKEGNSFLHNKTMNEAHAKKGGYYQIPTVSVGFDGIPWYGGTRAPLMSVEEYIKTNDWVKNTYLPTYAKKGTWQENAVWISTWNEYGEGTYIMPSGLNGFGYLDVLRKAYTNLPENHTDLIPTPEQAERINHMFPQHQRKLWREEMLDVTVNQEEDAENIVGTYTFLEKEGRHVNAEFTFGSDGSVSGVSTKDDVQVYPAGISKGINIDNVDSVKVTMKVPAGSTVQMFFATTDTPLTAETMLSKTAATGELTEYVFDFKAKKPTWKGTLTLLRLDPCHNGAGIEFYIEKIEFISKTASAKISSDGNAYESLGTYTFLEKEGRHVGADFTFGSDGSVSGVSTRDDVQVYPAGIAEGVNIDEVDAVKVTMQAPAGSLIQMFFATSDTPLTAETMLEHTAATGAMTEYVFSFKDKKPAWKGTLTLLRLDPCQNGEGIEFTVKKVELVKKAEIDESAAENAVPSLTVNGIDCTSKVPYTVLEDERILFPFDPETSVHYIMFVHHIWNKDKGELTLKADGHTVIYTAGKDTAVVDGKTQNLGYTVPLSDGLILLDFEQLSGFLGYTSKKDGLAITVESAEAQLIKDSIKRFNSASWEFNGYDSQGFFSNNGMIEVKDGYMHIENLTSNNDLIANNSDNYSINTKDYNTLEIKVRYKYQRSEGITSNDSFVIYYLTDLDKTWDEKKTLRVALKNTDSKGEWETYTIYLDKHAAWNGSISNVRVDPFNAVGYMDIDYIRLSFVGEKPKEDLSASIISNGDAEDTSAVTFYSINGKVTVEGDPSDSNNHGFVVRGNGGKNWTYIMQDTDFKSGDKYTVSFDARALPDTEGNKVDMVLGCNIQYKDASGGVNHGIGVVRLKADGSWAHFEAVVDIGEIAEDKGRMFSIYADPTGDNASGCFMIDNVVMTKI